MLWNLLLSQGFQPSKSFGMLLNPGMNGFLGNYQGFLSGSLPGLIALFMSISALYFIYRASLSPSLNGGTLHKPIYAIILALMSLEILYVLLSLESYVFGSIWSSGVDWDTLILQTSGSSLLSGNGIVRFILIAGYDIPIIAIFVIMAVRAALLLFAYVTLPFISLAIMIPPIEKYALTVWRTVIESSVLPIFMLLAFYPMVMVPGNSLVQIGSLFLSASIPLLLVERSRIFGNLTGSLTSVTMFDSLFESVSPSMAIPAIENYVLDSTLAGEMQRMGLPPVAGGIENGSARNTYAVDWNAAYQKSYAEKP